MRSTYEQAIPAGAVRQHPCRRRRRHWPTPSLKVMIAMSTMAVVAAACSSPSPSAKTGGSSSTSAAGNGLSAAQALVTKYENPSSHISITTPIGKTVPTGKTIDYVNCNVAACVGLYNSFVQAATLFGWHVKQLVSTGTPQSVQAAFQQAVNDKPNAVVYDGFSKAEFGPQLSQLKAEGTKVIEFAGTDPVGGGISAAVLTAEQEKIQGDVPAAEIIVDSHASHANILYVNLPVFSIVTAIEKAFLGYISQNCPSCTTQTLDISASALGTTSNQTIVSYLEAHPNINYLAISLANALTPGLPAALSAAGLSSRVKIVGNSAGIPDLAYVKQGQELAVGSLGDDALIWYVADALARVFTGQSASVDGTAPLPYQLLTKDNITSTTTLPVVASDYVADFKHLWGK